MTSRLERQHQLLLAFAQIWWQWFMGVEIMVGLASIFFFPSVGKAIDKRKIFLEGLCSFDWTIKLALLSICAAFSSTLKARKCSYLLVIKSRLAFKKVHWQKELDIFWILGSLWVRLFALWWGVEPDKHFEKLSLGLLNWARVWFMMPVWPHSF